MHPEDGNNKSSKQGMSLESSATHQLVDEETKQVGSVPFSVYWYYMSAGGGVPTIIIIALSCLWISGSWFMQNYFLGQWMEAMESNSRHRSSFTLGLYLFCVVSIVTAYTFRSLVKIAAAVKASKVWLFSFLFFLTNYVF